MILPETGKIIFVANNIKGAENFFAATTEDEKEKCRFVDINFNRLPSDCLESNSTEYEILRVKELYPLFKKFNFGLDIHSTRVDPEPSIINISDDLDHGLFSSFPSDMIKVISNMANIQTGIPVCKLYGGRDKKIPILGIETGIHVDIISFETAIKCSEIFCSNCGVLPKLQTHTKRNYSVYKVVKSVFYTDDKFETVRDFKAFEELTVETVLAENTNGEKILSPINGLTLFGRPKGHKPKTINDEEFFITEKPYSIEQ